jgi:hypothetical protein
LGFLFETERRIRCSAAHERDLAASVKDARRRAEHIERAARLSNLLLGSQAERFLLRGPSNYS